MAINVMIVDDSIFIRVLLKDILEKTKSEDIKVVASVSNGKEAIKELMSNSKIDVITLDIRMPEMNGLETLKEIMKIRKVPVLMISSLAKKGADETIEALSLGAIDFITKDNDEEANLLYSKEEEIRTKVIAISKTNISAYGMFEVIKKEQLKTDLEHVVAVGSSTGGPAALRILLSQIPKNFHAPIIIAQHMPEGGYIESLADKLNEVSMYRVKVVENGEIVKRDTAYVCPAGFNTEIFKRGTKLHLVLTKKMTQGIHKPSVDMLFVSLARIDKIKKSAVVLTGMGDDGAKGSEAIQRVGGIVVAESEKTALVYGMPKRVADLSIEKHIADINKIFKYIHREDKK